MTEERNLKASLEQRGAFVITSSGTVVTLLSGLGAVAAQATDFQIPSPVRLILIASVVSFLVAAGFGIKVNQSEPKYEEASADALKKLVGDQSLWEQPDIEAIRQASATRVKILSAARDANQEKGGARLPDFGIEPEIAHEMTRCRKPADVSDRSHERGRGRETDPGNGHEPADVL